MARPSDEKIVFWHRDLPPPDAEPIGDHTIDATSARVPGTLRQRDAVWNRCYQDLMDRAHVRLAQEIVRLGGDCAHVFKEKIEPRCDGRTGEVWLSGRFDYQLFQRQAHIDMRKQDAVIGMEVP
jgi:hypothetical protein